MSEEHGIAHYRKVYITLLVLLAISVAGPFLEIKAVTMMTAFGIAVVKAYMVAKNFMHVNIQRRYVAYILTTCLAFMFLFFAGVSPDVMKDEGTNWKKTEGWQTPARSMEERQASGGAHH